MNDALRERRQQVAAECADSRNPLLQRARAKRDADHVDALARELVEIHRRIETGHTSDAHDPTADSRGVATTTLLS